MPAMTSNRVQPPVEVEYRRAPRHRIVRRCVVRTPGAAGELRGVAGSISASGIAVALPGPLPAGTVVEVSAHELAGATPVRAQVVWINPFSHFWMCGCRFIDGPLSDEQVAVWRSSSTSSSV